MRPTILDGFLYFVTYGVTLARTLSCENSNTYSNDSNIFNMNLYCTNCLILVFCCFILYRFSHIDVKYIHNSFQTVSTAYELRRPIYQAVAGRVVDFSMVLSHVLLNFIAFPSEDSLLGNQSDIALNKF